MPLAANVLHGVVDSRSQAFSSSTDCESWREGDDSSDDACKLELCAEPYIGVPRGCGRLDGLLFGSTMFTA